MANLEKIQKWAGKIDEPEKEFCCIDVDGEGTITFDEFCDWAVQRHLDMD